MSAYIQASSFTRAGRGTRAARWRSADRRDARGSLVGQGVPEKKYDIKGTDIDSAKGGLKFLGRRVERRRDVFMWSADP